MISNFILSALPTALNFFNERDEVNQINRERLKQGERDEAKYRNDFNRDVLLWQNESTDREIAVDNKWQEVLSKIASDDLKLWSGISKAGLATQEAYATMMSVGATEQTGRRSSTTTNRRKAVLAYAATMANVASRLSLSRDNAALNRDTWGNAFTQFAQESQVKNMTGRPMPGTPPPPIPLENQPDFLTGLILPLAGNFVDWKKQQKELDPPFKDEEMRPTPPTPEEPLPPGIPEEVPEGEYLPDFDTGEVEPEQIGDFFIKRSRNIASSRLGSSFLTTAT
tara:strand:+ start:92 stop:937 length:846 start_codon:yes stop_codon:yes gene_type:complete